MSIDISSRIDTRPTGTTDLSESVPPFAHSSTAERNRILDAIEARGDFQDFMRSLPVSLNPAMIMAMLQRRMTGLDSQISASVSAMEAQQRGITELQAKCETILAIKAVAGPDGDVSYSTLVTVHGETKSVRDWLADSDIHVAEISHRSEGSAHDFNHYKGAGLQAALEGLQTEIKKLNQGNEMKMMDLQSLMQQRSSEISLATNMLKSVQDGTDAIVRNIG